MIKERMNDFALRVCDKCGHEQWVSYWNLVRKKEHLCRSCSNKFHGEKRQGRHPSPFKGLQKEPKKLGSTHLNSGGYFWVWIGKHTLPNAGGYYLEHRLVAELSLGRSLEAHEIVHHINGDKTDNRPSNLYVCTEEFGHRKVHGQLERVAMEAVKAGLIKFDRIKGKYYLDPNWGDLIRKSGELLGNPEEGNQQRSFRDMSTEERSTTIQKWSRLKQAEAPDPEKSGDDIVSSS